MTTGVDGGGGGGGLAQALLSVKHYVWEGNKITSQPFRKAPDSFLNCVHTDMCSIEFGFLEMKAMNLWFKKSNSQE